MMVWVTHKNSLVLSFWSAFVICQVWNIINLHAILAHFNWRMLGPYRAFASHYIDQIRFVYFDLCNHVTYIVPAFPKPIPEFKALTFVHYELLDRHGIMKTYKKNGKIFRVTSLFVTVDVAACLQRPEWWSGQSSWRPLHCTVQFYKIRYL